MIVGRGGAMIEEETIGDAAMGTIAPALITPSADTQNQLAAAMMVMKMMEDGCVMMVESVVAMIEQEEEETVGDPAI